MNNLVDIFMNYKTNCLIEYGLVFYNESNKFVRDVFREYFKTYIDNRYYKIFHTIDDNNYNLGNLKLEFNGCCEELLYDYQACELEVSNEEYSRNVSIIKELKDISYEVVRIDKLTFKDKDDISCCLEEFVSNNSLLNKLIGDKINKLVSLVKSNYTKVNKVLNYDDEYFNIGYRNFYKCKRYKYAYLDFNIKLLNNYRIGLVKKSYKKDEFDLYKFELLMKKISINLLKDIDDDTLYFIEIKDSFISRGKLIDRVYRLIDNPLILQHVVLLVNYNTYKSHEDVFSFDCLLGCIQDYMHIPDIYKKTDAIYGEGVFNFLIVYDYKYKDREYFLEYKKDGLEVLLFEEE